MHQESAGELDVCHGNTKGPVLVAPVIDQTRADTCRNFSYLTYVVRSGNIMDAVK